MGRRIKPRAMLKNILILCLSLISSVSISAAEQRPWKCVTEKSIGAKTTEGEIYSTSFAGLPKFRIKPMGAWVDDLTGPDFFKNMLHVSIDSAINRVDVGVSLIRDVSQDPKKYASWEVCRVNEMPTSGEKPPYNLVFCDAALLRTVELRLDTSTGRFTSVTFGNWHNTGNGEKPTTDSWFDFGTCTPYYD